MTETILFYAFSALTIASAILVVAARNAFHSALYLGCTLFAAAGLFVLLNAHFIAVIQVLIYIGTVVVLTLFVINLTKDITGTSMKGKRGRLLLILLTCALALSFIVIVVSKANFGTETPALSGIDVTASIGEKFMGDYVIPFEVVSVLILASLLAAIAIVNKDREEEK